MFDANNNIWIASFDIGKLNFAFYIEELNKKELINLPFISKTKRYNQDGTFTEEFSEIVNKVTNNGKTILFKNTNLTEGCDKKSYLDQNIFHNMTDLLDDYGDYWDNCSIFIIEKQMSFGKRHNTMAIKLGQHCWSYFSFKYSRFKEIIEFPAYYKTIILGAKKTQKQCKNGKIKYLSMDKTKRKKWCVETALNILKKRNDLETIYNIKQVKKKDDLADVLCQLQAFKILRYLDI